MNENNLQGLFSRLRAAREEFARREVAGERFTVPRENEDGVDVILYRPKSKTEKKLPVLFNLHGGGWIGGDAVLMDSFCTTIADEVPALVVNVNYKKLDEHTFPYPQTELSDAVEYFAAHADAFGIDVKRFFVGGHSAGAHIAAGAAVMLKERGFALAGQLLVYPVTIMLQLAPKGAENLLDPLALLFPPTFEPNQPLYSPATADAEALNGLAPALIIVCGLDELQFHGVEYAHKLIDARVPVTLREYPKAFHGFLEVNRPEYEGDSRRSPEQAKMCRHCERVIADWLRSESMTVHEEF